MAARPALAAPLLLALAAMAGLAAPAAALPSRRALKYAPSVAFEVG